MAELVSELVLTSAITGLRTFLARPGARHAFVIGPPGSGKTSALHYLAADLRRQNHLVLIVELGHIETGDQLTVHVARSLLELASTADTASESQVDVLAEFRVQFQAQVTIAQRLSEAPQLIDRLIALVTERLRLSPRAFIFLDGLDATRQAGELAVTIESLAESITSASLVVTSRSFPTLDRLRQRTAFDTFNLVGLTAAESAELVHRLLVGRPISKHLLEQMISRAGGSPYVLTLLASLFRDTGELGPPEDGYPINKLLDRVLVRLGTDQIGEDARLLLSLLVLLQPISISYLLEISGLPDQRAQAALRKVTALALLGSGQTGTVFAHSILTKYYLEHFIINQDIHVSKLQCGDEAAERDALFAASFMPPRDLHAITCGSKTVVLGDRGSGKSAVFRALDQLGGPEALTDAVSLPNTLIATSQNPASFVQQITADDTSGSSADGFKAIWLLYATALAAREVHPTASVADRDIRSFVRDARTILRRMGWDNSIKNESRTSRWIAAVRSMLPEKVTLKLGPVTVEPNWSRRTRSWGSNDIRIDDFIDRTDRILELSGKRLLIVFDQLDEAFKYQRDKQEALIQGLFLAEAFLSVRRNIRLVVLLRTDLFEIYDIQEKNKFVSRMVRLDWSRAALMKQLLVRLFSNPQLQAIVQSLRCGSLSGSTLTQIQLRIAFPVEVEGKPFEDWLFESLRKGKNQIAPRQIVLFLNLVKDIAAATPARRQVPLFSEKEVADAMTKLSELSYQEVISDFRVATSFVRSCRAGKLMEFEIEKVTALFDLNEGSPALQLERLERLGFIERLLARENDSLIARFRVPRLFTRCWQMSM